MKGKEAKDPTKIVGKNGVVLRNQIMILKALVIEPTRFISEKESVKAQKR